VLHLHVLGELLLLSVVALWDVLALVHERLDSLLALWSLGLELVQRVIENLSVVGEELSKLLQVELDNTVLVEQLTNDLEDVL
jgi:hypothetical protein